MEFFATADIQVRAAELQKNLCVGNLPQWCASIERVLENQGDRGSIYCIWGEFRVHRELIRDGVRFSLPTCPNGLQWTVSVENSAPAGKASVHCTINRREHAPDFIESVERFMADWKSGLEGSPRHAGGQAPKPCECMPWFG